MNEILAALTDGQWRVRESACMALCDLLGRNVDLNEISHLLPEIWKSLFRVLDDIKESVRKAALASVKALGKVSQIDFPIYLQVVLQVTLA